MQVQDKIWTEPIKGAYGRSNRLWAVNGIGGATRVNGRLWTRGSPGNYTKWAEMGFDDWSWEKVEPYFKKLENSTGSSNKSRGHDGTMELRLSPCPFEWPG